MAKVRADEIGPLPLKNVASFVHLAMRLVDRDPRVPGIGVFYGPSGYGKTEASIYAGNKTRALRIEMGVSWTRKILLESILFELEAPARNKETAAQMTARIKQLLAEDRRRLLIIDEAGFLFRGRHYEAIREIQKATDSPILLIGEEKLSDEIREIENFSNLVLNWVAAQPCDIADTQALAAAFCPGLILDGDLLGEIRAQSQGRARRIVTNLNDIREVARNRGLQRIGLGDWTDGYYTGEAPLPRTADQLKLIALKPKAA